MPLNIYYLDDELDLCENFVDCFSSDKYKISIFTDPYTAIEAIKKNSPDVLFLDYRLPGTTGDEVARAVDPNIPKILITGDIHLNTEYKFESVVSKPYDESTILAILAKYESKP